MTSRGSATTSARKAAEQAALAALQNKVDVVGELAELGATVTAVTTARDDAERSLGEARRAYAEHYGRARAAGWTIAQLTEVGCPPELGGTALRGSRRRSQSRATSTTGSAAAARSSATSGATADQDTTDTDADGAPATPPVASPAVPPQAARPAPSTTALVDVTGPDTGRRAG